MSKGGMKVKIYIDDNDFKCHASNPDGIFREIEDKFFDGKCAEFIEGYCREEEGKSVIHYPWKLDTQLNAVQREYERQQLTEYSEALQLLGVDLNDN